MNPISKTELVREVSKRQQTADAEKAQTSRSDEALSVSVSVGCLSSAEYFQHFYISVEFLSTGNFDSTSRAKEYNFDWG